MAADVLHSRPPHATASSCRHKSKHSAATVQRCTTTVTHTSAGHVTARPAPLIKKKSASISSPSFTSKKDKPTSCPDLGSADEDQYDETMAMSFLQFCATCDKQIIVPSSSVLYCSESCRRRDTSKALESSLHSPFASRTSLVSTDDEDGPIPDIVAPSFPRSRQSAQHSLASSFSSEDDTHYTAKESEAARYLRSFHQSSSTGNLPSAARTSSSRPRMRRTAASALNMSTMPSLSHTPASPGSMPIPFTPSTRPLPPRHGAMHGESKSLDLVLPLVSVTPPPPPPSAPNAAAGHRPRESMSKPAQPFMSPENATSGTFRRDDMSTSPLVGAARSSVPGGLSQLLERSRLVQKNSEPIEPQNVDREG